VPTGRLIGIGIGTGSGHGPGGPGPGPDPETVPIYVFFLVGTKGHLYADIHFDFVPFDSVSQEAPKANCRVCFVGPRLPHSPGAMWQGGGGTMMMMLIARYKLNMHSTIQPGWIYIFFMCAIYK